jgi:hypothetical protein
MGLFNLLKTYGKARIARGVMRRAMGGNIAALLTAAWFGRKLYRSYRARRVPAGGYYR